MEMELQTGSASEPPQHINAMKHPISHSVTWDERLRPPSSVTRTVGTNSGKLNGFLSESFDPETEASPGLDVGQQRHLQDAC